MDDVETMSESQVRTAIEEAHRNIDAARATLVQADTKASLLAAGAFPVAAVLLATPSLVEPRGSSTVFAWTAAAVMLLGVVFLGSAIWPRLSGRTGLRAAAGVAHDRIEANFRRMARDPEVRLRFAVEECRLLSTLAVTKFQRLRAAIVCFAIAGALIIATAVALR